MTFKRTRLKSALPQTVTLPPPDADGAAERNGEHKADAAPHHEPSAAEATAADQASVRSGSEERTRVSKRRLQRRATPLLVLQQPLQAGVRKVFDLRRLIIVLALSSSVLLLPQPEGLSVEGHRALALFVFTGSILALEPAPLPIAALMVPIAQIALGIDTVDGAFAPFGRPVVFLILGSLFLAEALRKHGLTRRLALYSIIYSAGRFEWLLLGLMMMTGLLSMWVLNTATAAVLIPVAITIAQRVQRQEDAQRVLKMLVLGIGYSSSIGGIATVMGSGENAIASGQLESVTSFGFLNWMAYGVPVSLMLLPLSWLLLLRLFPGSKIEIDTLPALREITRLGTFSRSEIKIILALSISVILWMSGSAIEQLLGLPRTILSSAVVAIGAVAALSVEEVIDWNDLKGVNWGVFFVIGAGLTLGDALDKTGAGLWFAEQLSPLLMNLPYAAILFILVLLGFVLTQFMNNVTLGAILTPILITLGHAANISPTRLLIPTIFALALAYALPAASARMTLVAVSGAVDRKDMVRAGMWVGVPSAVVVWLFFYILSQVGLI